MKAQSIMHHMGYVNAENALRIKVMGALNQCCAIKIHRLLGGTMYLPSGLELGFRSASNFLASAKCERVVENFHGPRN